MSEEERKPVMAASENSVPFVADRDKVVSALAAEMLYEGVFRQLILRGVIAPDALGQVFLDQSAVLESVFAHEAAGYGLSQDRAKEVMRSALVFSQITVEGLVIPGTTKVDALKPILEESK